MQNPWCQGDQPSEWKILIFLKIGNNCDSIWTLLQLFFKNRIRIYFGYTINSRKSIEWTSANGSFPASKHLHSVNWSYIVEGFVITNCTYDCSKKKSVYWSKKRSHVCRYRHKCHRRNIRWTSFCNLFNATILQIFACGRHQTEKAIDYTFLISLFVMPSDCTIIISVLLSAVCTRQKNTKVKCIGLAF